MGRGSGPPRAGVGGRDAEQDELFGGDPRTAPGLPRPIGWRVRMPDGTAGYDKFGPADTDWIPIGGVAGGSVTQIIAGNNVTISPAGGTGAVTINAGGSSAAWPFANPRVFAVDGVNGDDTHAGFADAASNSAADYRAACVAAGAVAKKTLAGLAAIFPAIGDGRMAVILIAAGTYTDDLATVLGGIEGYASGCPVVRGTVTNATAGSTAFTGTAADEAMAGAVTATGMNAAGYNATAAVNASNLGAVTKVGGGAPGFGAEPAVPLGWRVRFDSATATADLRNVCRQICQVSVTTTLRLQSALPRVPAAGDVFYIEMAGVVIPAFNYAAPANGQLGTQFVGIQSSGAWGLQFADAHFALCGAQSLVAQQQTVNALVTDQAYTHPILGAITVGGGFRSEGSVAVNSGYATLAGLVSATSTTLTDVQNVLWGAGCAAQNLVVNATRLSQGFDAATPGNIGSSDPAGIGVPHTFLNDGNAAVAIDGSDVTLRQFNVVGAGATPCIQLRGRCNIVVADFIQGSALNGNFDVGLDLQKSAGSQVQISLGFLPTLTGTAGDVRWAGTPIDVWTNFNLQEQYDSAGNHIYQVGINAGPYSATITPSVTLGVNNSAGPIGSFNIVTSTSGAGFQFRPCRAIDPPFGIIGAGVNNGTHALVGSLSGFRLIAFDGTPAVGAFVYVSGITPGLATNTNPGNQVPIGVVVATSVGNLAVVHCGPALKPVSLVTADWPVDRARVYAIDGTNGDDKNIGYADPTTSSAGDLALATQAAGLVAKKTLAGLGLIFPRAGAGRMAVVVIRTGTYAGGLDRVLGGTYGYVDGFPLVRGTDTNATAASVAFDGSAGDETFVGAITATGMNAAGYNPTGAATASSLPCTKVGGAAPGFTAGGLAVPIGWRIRFASNTATVALQNACAGVAEITTTTTIIPAQPLPAAPAAADVFFLEMAGVNCAASVLDATCESGPLTFTGASLGTQIVGVNVPGASLGVTAGNHSMIFCGAGELDVGQGSSGNVPTALQSTYFYADPAGGFPTPGGGLRIDGNANCGQANFNGLTSLVITGTCSISGATAMQLTDGCAVKRIDFGNSFVGVSTGATGVVGTPNFGNNFPVVQAPIIRGGSGTNGLRIVGSMAQLQKMDIQGCGASPCISVRGASVVAISGVISGSTGNTDVGLDLVNARGALILLTATPTVTGTAGDIRLAGGQIITWAQAVATGITDSKGNRILSGPPLGIMSFTGAILGGAGATVSYLGDAGIIGAVNQTTAFRRPTSLRLMLRLRVTSISNTATNAVTVTLYKNGVATAMQVSIPAATAANTKFVDSAHPILYADGDDFDLRLDDAADVGAQVNVSAGLEYAA